MSIELYYGGEETQEILDAFVSEYSGSVHGRIKIERPEVTSLYTRGNEDEPASVRVSGKMESDFISLGDIVRAENAMLKEYASEGDVQSSIDFSHGYRTITIDKLYDNPDKKEGCEDESIPDQVRYSFELSLRHNKQGILLTSGGSSSTMPSLEYSLTFPKTVSNTDVDFIKKLYKTILPADAFTDPREVFQELELRIHHDNSQHGFNRLAGYGELKAEVHQGIVFPNLNREDAQELRKRTRKVEGQVAYNCYRLVGVPGVGKTAFARAIAHELGYRFIKVTSDQLFSKWYGESGKNVGKLFRAAKRYGDVVLFIDEGESVTASRDGNLHEETVKTLSVLNAETSEITQDLSVVVLLASNRDDMMDDASKDRFQVFNFGVPTQSDLRALFGHYMHHLPSRDHERLAEHTVKYKLTPRKIMKIATHAENKFLMDKKQGVTDLDLPSIDYYFEEIERKQKEDEEKDPMGFH